MYIYICIYTIFRQTHVQTHVNWVSIQDKITRVGFVKLKDFGTILRACYRAPHFIGFAGSLFLGFGLVLDLFVLVSPMGVYHSSRNMWGTTLKHQSALRQQKVKALKLMASIHCGSCLPTAKEVPISQRWESIWDDLGCFFLYFFRIEDLKTPNIRVHIAT